MCNNCIYIEMRLSNEKNIGKITHTKHVYIVYLYITLHIILYWAALIFIMGK